MVGRSEHRFSAARRARFPPYIPGDTSRNSDQKNNRSRGCRIRFRESARHRYATAGQARRYINRQRLVGVGVAIANKQISLVLAVGTPSHLAQFRNALTFHPRGFDWVEGANRGIVVPQAMPECVRR